VTTTEHYLGSEAVRWPHELRGPWAVTAHWAAVDGRAVCVGLDLRSFTLKADPAPEHLVAKPVNAREGWQEVTTPAVRAVPIARMVELARQQAEVMRADAPALLAALGLSPDGPALQVAEDQVDAFAPPQPRRGPPRMLTDDQLRTIVAPAYRRGGRKPIPEVQKALLQSGALRPPVTHEQARKAVARARKLPGLDFPPYRRASAPKTPARTTTRKAKP